MPGPLLFDIYVTDLDDNVANRIRTFMDNSSSRDAVDNKEDCWNPAGSGPAVQLVDGFYCRQRHAEAKTLILLKASIHRERFGVGVVKQLQKAAGHRQQMVLSSTRTADKQMTINQGQSHNGHRYAISLGRGTPPPKELTESDKRVSQELHLGAPGADVAIGATGRFPGFPPGAKVLPYQHARYPSKRSCLVSDDARRRSAFGGGNTTAACSGTWASWQNDVTDQKQAAGTQAKVPSTRDGMLTIFYMERLEQAIEEGVEGLGFMLTSENQFTGQEYHSVTELVEKGNRSGASKLFLDLVMEKGSGAWKVMWESFVKLHHRLPKLSRILNEIWERGDGQFAYMDTERGLSEVPKHLKDVRRKHMETLRAQTEKLRVNTILMREKVKVFQLVDRYAELTVISTVRDRTLVEHELLARGRDHEEWREKDLRGMSAAVAGVPGIGKTTMVQKIVYDWATGKIYQQFQFVFSFKFRDLNTINCRINLKELILHHYPYFGNILGEIWKQTEGLLFIFDGLDEFKDKINFVDGRRDTESQYTDPEFKCNVSDIVYSLIQGKLLPGCSVLVTTRPTALHLLEKADISVWAEILGFVGEERKEYFIRYFEDQTEAEAVFKHVKENEILYTMSYNPSYCWILALVLGPFFTQRVRDPQRVPKTITQLYSYYIYNILKNHGREIENPRDVLLRVGQMAFRGVSEKKIVFTGGDLINYNLQPSQFLSGFLMELLEREDSAQSVVYTFPHLTIQEFVAAVAQFLIPDGRDIMKLLTEAHCVRDGRFEVFLRFVAGLSNPMTARGLEEFLGPFPHQTTCRVIDWVMEEVKRQSGQTGSEAGKRSLLNTLHYLFESQNRGLAQAALGSVERFSLSGMTLTPIDCAVLSHVIGLCDTIKQLDLENCHIQCEGIQRLGPGLLKCQELRLGRNDLGDSGVKLVSAALRNPECKIQELWLWDVGLTDSGAEDLVSALSTNPSLTDLNLGSNSLTDGSVPGLRRLILTLPNLEQIWLRGNRFSETGRKELRSLQEPRPGLMVDL
ncbi:NACHT, LRR and PYD domains-containing protein 3-like [Hypanus sabinus]|uniref:NACHT, LRR and PYD domains-containing protein 3-like n=1 Tax=Hypanus sabinus TaxID=79690 RepID=UPI0028C46665|nr:NACHT, LRR and PYD domains-containing protein 3-like [Hypanus sabinus]